MTTGPKRKIDSSPVSNQSDIEKQIVRYKSGSISVQILDRRGAKNKDI